MQLEIFLVFFVVGLAEYSLGEFVMWLRMKSKVEELTKKCNELTTVVKN